MTTETTLARASDAPLTFDDAQRRMIRDTFANGASDQEFAVLLEVAKTRRLNPLLRQIHFVKRWDSNRRMEVWSVQASIDGLRAVAERTGLYAGQDEPEFVDGPDGTLLLCKVRVYRKDWPRPAVGVAYWSEYVQTMRDKVTGKERPAAMWARMPRVMLAKCAESLALRKAFPEDASGLYTDAEMGQADNAQPSAPALPRGEPAPSPAVPDVDPDASRAYAAYVTAVEGAASCQAVAAAWMALLPALRLEGHDPAEWTTDALALAVRRVADLGVVGAKGALREIATSTGDLPGIVDELLAQPAAAVPQWVASRADVLRTLAAPGPEIVRVVAARRYGGVATLDTASTAAAGRALAEAVAALSAREPGDDDEPPPSAPQPPPQGRRTRAAATGPSSDSAPVDGPAAWLGDDAAAEAHAAGWSHARHVEASVRRHAPTVSGDAYDRLVRVATARMEALSQPDAYGTRPTAAGLHRTVSRWAAEGPVAARRAA